MPLLPCKFPEERDPDTSWNPPPDSYPSVGRGVSTPALAAQTFLPGTQQRMRSHCPEFFRLFQSASLLSSSCFYLQLPSLSFRAVRLGRQTLGSLAD